MVEHTFHGSEYMLNGWPGGEPSPSYAHVAAGETQMFHDAIAADREAVAQGMIEAGMVMAGAPEDCTKVLDAFQEVGVDQVIVHMQMGGVPHDRIMESIELMGTEVLPRYHDDTR
jgi:alkanesulfonate monooxygenase SsuD/methylene tetrahydromethanopterin reductase-like flavin-dependent oxidoreductase (luciferase family)